MTDTGRHSPNCLVVLFLALLVSAVVSSAQQSPPLTSGVPVGSIADPAQSAVIDQVAAISKLQSADWLERREGVSMLLRVPGDSLTPLAVEAVLVQLDRLKRNPKSKDVTVPSDAGPEAAFDHRADLLTVASRSTDERVIPYLAEALGSGNTVSNALAVWGDKGAMAVLAEANHQSGDPSFALMALRSLKANVDRNHSLSEDVKTKISTFARPRLHGQQISSVVVLALELFGSLKDRSVLGAIQAIAKARTAADVGLELIDAKISTVDPFLKVRLKAVEVLQRPW